MLVTNFLTKGSRVPHIQSILVEIKAFEYLNDFVLIPKWIPRESDLIKLADLGSKMYKSSDEYGLSTHDYLYVKEFFGVTSQVVDAFATHTNKKEQLFISHIPQVNNYDLNFFHHTMKSDLLYYCHPPVKYIIRCIKKIILYPNVRAIVVMPFWISHSFVNFLHQAGFFNSYIKKFLLFNPTYVAYNSSTMFTGQKNFKTLCVLIDTATTNAVEYNI